jgi:hypothetical protein
MRRALIALSLIGAPLQVLAADNYADFPASDPTADCRDCCGNIIAAFNSCINKEQLYHDLAKSDWPNVSDKNRSYCVRLMSKSVPRAFYQGLEVCLNERLRAQANETPAEFHY